MKLRVGDRVRGRTCDGREFTGVVTEVHRYSVTLDGKYHTPMSLITGKMNNGDQR